MSQAVNSKKDTQHLLEHREQLIAYSTVFNGRFRVLEAHFGAKLKRIEREIAKAHQNRLH